MNFEEFNNIDEYDILQMYNDIIENGNLLISTNYLSAYCRCTNVNSICFGYSVWSNESCSNTSGRFFAPCNEPAYGSGCCGYAQPFKVLSCRRN